MFNLSSDLRMNHKEFPVCSWIRKPRLLIYFSVVFTSLNYTGFLVVVLEPYLRQVSKVYTTFILIYLY